MASRPRLRPPRPAASRSPGRAPVWMHHRKDEGREELSGSCYFKQSCFPVNNVFGAFVHALLQTLEMGGSGHPHPAFAQFSRRSIILVSRWYIRGGF